MIKTSPLGMIDRLYPINGGLAVAPDRSVYTPGKWIGERAPLPCNAYLIRRGGEWILWDTGISDGVAKASGGEIIAHDIRGIVARTVECQLEDIGVAPADIGTVILSHAHFDHAGNAALFPGATWYVQRREHEAMFGNDPDRYGYVPTLYDVLRRARVELMDGDFDVFGDGSLRVLFTPGHTPGHCSLLVRLAHTGPILLTADVAHDRYNLDHRCVPTINSDAQATRDSMERIVAVAREEGAALWINHDIVQTATIPHAPAYVD